jgi:hypothetical protein
MSPDPNYSGYITMGKKKKERTKQQATVTHSRNKPVKCLIPALSISQQRWFYGLALIFCLSLILKLFLTKGHTYSLDGASHSAQTLMVYDSLRDGELPLWSNRWYGGYPLLQFYPPLFFILTALLNFIVKDLFSSIKLMAFIGQLLSGITAFLLVEEITDDRQAGFIGGMAFALAPWHIYHILDFCRHTAIFVYTLLPLPFLFFEKYRHQKLRLLQAGILIGLSLSLIIAFQYGYAIFVTLFLVVYVLFNSVNLKKPYFVFKHLWLLFAAGLVCLGTSIAFVGPYFIEGKYVRTAFKLLSENKFPLDSATFHDLITRSSVSLGHKGYIGLSFLVLSLLGIASAVKYKKYPLILIYAFSFYLVLGHQTLFYKYIPFIYTQQATERLILYLILFMAVMAGEGISFLKTVLFKPARVWVSRITFLALVIICFIDMSITRNRRWAADLGMSGVYESFHQYIKGYDLPHARTIRSIQICSNPQVEWLFAGVFPAVLTIKTPTSIIRGYLDLLAARNLPYIDDGKNWIKQDLETGNFKLPSQKFCYLMNIAYTFYVNPNLDIQILENPSRTPAIATGKLSWREEFSHYPDNAESGITRRLIDQFKLSPKRNSADQVFMINDYKLPDRPFDMTSTLKVLDFTQTTNKSFLEVKASHDCYLVVAQSYYPFLRVFVDQQQVPFYETALCSMALPFPAGLHKVRIEPCLSFVRKVCYSLNLIFIFLVVVVYWRSSKYPSRNA